ncbi:DNA-binding protein [Kitasatospora sp. NPDC001527]|uniref:DNA-binding protein n=1 Tax=Kitasatospora sp. NPDC001527 TaxID=3154519 RepID=UPI00333013F9
MIQHGRDAIDVSGVAQLAGVSVPTWNRNKERRAAFAKAVKPLPGSQRPVLYDVAQARAFLAGEPVPELPVDPPEHPDDLLTDAEVAAVAGVSASTVRDEAADGRMDKGTEVAGRRFWTRAAAEARRDRKAAHRGRIPGSKNKQPRRRPAEERAAEVAAELAAAVRGERDEVTAAEVAARYGISPRTAQDAITRAQELAR